MISLTRALIPLARKAYVATPFPALRSLYFKAFCRAVRGRTVQSDVDGSRFELQLGEMIDLALYLGKFEPDVVAAIQKECRPGMIVADIGANVGAHALRLARIVGSAGRVYAFEPTDFAFRKLVRNASLNDLPSLEPLQLLLSDENVAGREITIRSSWRTDGRSALATTRVDFVRLDDWCAARGVSQIDLIKMDVDGNEFPIVAGATSLIARCKPTFIMEAVGPHFDDASRNPYEVLADHGYRFQDTKTGVHYAGPKDIGALLPRGDVRMTRSLNVIARAGAEA
jgi:FkbM family methyltransferase